MLSKTLPVHRPFLYTFTMRPLLFLLLSVLAFAQNAALDSQAQTLIALANSSPKLHLTRTELSPLPAHSDWAMEMVSSVAAAADGTIYALQRGSKADPIIAFAPSGKVLRSWGRGLFKTPHSIRVDPEGHVWTVDAESSMIYEFSNTGQMLLSISVGGQPANAKSNFQGTTDIAFAPNGNLFISDGYLNARILEYSSKGKLIRQWGTAGTGPGQFHLPHAIAVAPDGTIYVADRENGRIQRFNQLGKYIGEWGNLGKTFSLKFALGELWIGTQPRNQPNGAPGWLMKIDHKTGSVIGVVASTGHHSVDVTGKGELLTGTRPDKVLWFR